MDGAGTLENPFLIFDDVIRKDSWWSGYVDLTRPPSWSLESNPAQGDNAICCGFCGKILVDGENMIEEPETQTWMHFEHLENTGINEETEGNFGDVLPFVEPAWQTQ